MASMVDWAEFISGDYQGWIRSSACDWEDIIGVVNFECRVHTDERITVIITNLELGKWTGSFRPGERILEGSTGQGDTYFRCTFQEREQGPEIQGCFYGEIYELPAKPLYEFNFASNWRKPYPPLS